MAGAGRGNDAGEEDGGVSGQRSSRQAVAVSEDGGELVAGRSGMDVGGGSRQEMQCSTIVMRMRQGCDYDA